MSMTMDNCPRRRPWVKDRLWRVIIGRSRLWSSNLRRFGSGARSVYGGHCELFVTSWGHRSLNSDNQQSVRSWNSFAVKDGNSQYHSNGHELRKRDKNVIRRDFHILGTKSLFRHTNDIVLNNVKIYVHNPLTYLHYITYCPTLFVLWEKVKSWSVVKVFKISLIIRMQPWGHAEWSSTIHSSLSYIYARIFKSTCNQPFNKCSDKGKVYCTITKAIPMQSSYRLIFCNFWRSRFESPLKWNREHLCIEC